MTSNNKNKSFFSAHIRRFDGRGKSSRHFPLGDGQEPEQHHVRGHRARGHSHGIAQRHQVRHGELPRPLQTPLQVRKVF